MAPLNIGIIGAGGIAHAHASGMLWHHDLFRLAKVAEARPEARERFAARFGFAGSCADWRGVVDDPAIDAVVVLLPHHLHEEVCVAALGAGKHVLVEKPIARTLEEADRIIAAARRNARCLMVAHNQRYDARHRRIRRMIDDGTLGEVFLARADHYQDLKPPADGWWRSREQVGGGSVIGSGIHRLDLLRWYLGEPEEISAQLLYAPSRLEGEATCVSTIRFARGGIAEFLITWALHGPGYETLGVFGSGGSVTIPREGSAQMVTAADHRSRALEPDQGESMWEHFRRCIDTGAEPLTSGPDGRASLALVLDVVRAGETRQIVRATRAPAAAAATSAAIGA